MYNELSRLYSFVHTQQEDEESIHIHYDTGTKLFQLFLDSTMTYTSANFNHDFYNDNINTNNFSYTHYEDEMLELYNGQVNKVSRITSKANIQKNDYVLDIGCGFGYLASFIANMTQASRVLGITISNDQLNYAQTHFNKHSGHKNLQYLYSDYRDLHVNQSNIFDAIVSVEMVEAIGKDQLNVYFDTVSRLLKPNKRFVIQYMTYNGWYYPSTYQEKTAHDFVPTFVCKYIFPGGFVPHENRVHEMAYKAGLELIHSETFGKHYARTLEIWLHNLQRNKKEIISHYNEQTYLTFEYYLAWSESLYRAEILNEVQMIFQKRDLDSDHNDDIGGQYLKELIHNL